MPIGTTTIMRQPPERRFENYIFTRAVDASVGLTSILDSQFKPCSPASSGDDPGLGGSGDGVSVPLPLGFDFQFDNITYKHFSACTHGWLALVDPILGTFNASEVMSAGVWQNPYINSTFTSNAVLLAPWFDDSRNIYSQPAQLAAASYSSAKIARIQAGLEPPPSILNTVAFGVRYFHDHKCPQGRRCIVRWTIASNYYTIATSTSVITFEAVIYESGTIEFRYMPRVGFNRMPSVINGATVGIFMPNGTHRFRDFAVGLGYRDGARREYIYGAFKYTSSYIDTCPPGNDEAGASAPYTVVLKPETNWPGLYESGCVMTFSPPVNRRKLLPRKEIRTQDSKVTYPLVARTGDSRLGISLSSFDDRRSAIYSQASGSWSSGSWSGGAPYSGSFITSGKFKPNAKPIEVNYPSTLTRFFGGSGLGTLERQDLFSGDFLVTGSIVKSAVDPYIGGMPATRIDPFNETFQHDQDQLTLTSSFYATGSTVLDVGPGFDYPLRSKTQVKFSLPIYTQINMPGATSSIFYYNQKNKCWEVPANSTYTLANGGTTPPVPNPAAGGDWANPLSYVGVLGGWPEDARGFGPIGNIASSGSHTVTGYPSSTTDAQFGANYNISGFTNAINHSYPKSIRNNNEYAPNAQETFTIPITAPFLIEKATFEIPLAFGPGWFSDQTQCFFPLSGTLGFVGSFDFAGPALTISLMREVQQAENTPTPAIRDLILTGTITHSVDYVSGVVISNFPPHDPSLYFMRPVGFRSYAEPAGAVVQVPGDLSFTGSVLVEAQASSVAGIDVAYFEEFLSGTATTNVSGVLGLLTTPALPLVNSYDPVTQKTIGSQVTPFISPFGRAGTGFAQAGRAILGNEYGTLENGFDPTGNTVANPFYVAQSFSGLSARLKHFLNSASSDGPSSFDVISMAVVPIKGHFASPYLVMPGDKLILSISKMRPFVYNVSGQTISSSLPHDVQLMPGNINVTLYGSLVQQGVEFHDTLNQPLASDVCHEIIGVDPVLDQFEPAYRFEYSGSFTDNYVLGADRKLSRLAATLSGTVTPAHTRSNVTAGSFVNGTPSSLKYPQQVTYTSVPAQLTANVTDTLINPSKAFRDRPWIELVGAGGVRLSQFIDSSERYWDSMMPAIDQCFAADGSGIYITSHGVYGDFRQVDPGISGSSAYNPGQARVGWIGLDNQNPVLLNEGYGPLINGNWNKSFPFEPRYVNVSRQLNIASSFLATYEYTGVGSPPFVPITPVSVSGLMFGTVALGTAVESVNYPTSFVFANYYSNFPMLEWFADCNLSSKTAITDVSAQMPANIFVTGSTMIDDAARGLFGFGDRNTSYQVTNSGVSSLLGTNHFPDSGDVEGPHPDGQYTYFDSNNFRFSPRIRGWKYGVLSALPTFTKAYWRRGHYGQFRDMLEQRPNGKFYQSPEKNPNTPNFRQGASTAVVQVDFVDPASGRLTDPENTWSSNINFECTSSFPFFDGVPTNRPIILPTTLNLHPNTILRDRFNNIRIG